MVARKRKAVVNADAEQLERVQELIRQGRYRTVSEFVRESMSEKLDRLEESRVAEQVARYCANESSDDDALIAAQAFDATRASPRRKKR